MDLVEPAFPALARFRSLTPPKQPREVRGQARLDSARDFESLVGKPTASVGSHLERPLRRGGYRPVRAASLSDGSTAIATAIQQRDFEALEHLLQKEEVSVDFNCHGLRPLHLALRATFSLDDGGLRMVELLLRHGANPNLHHGDAKMEFAPLHGAALLGDLALVSLLLGFRADTNGVDANGSTPLHALCQQKLALGGATAKRQAVDMLLRHGANPMALDSEGCTPEELASEPQLRAQLRRASLWYTSAAMTAACRRVQGTCNATSGGNPFCAYPELHDKLVQFVSGSPSPWNDDHKQTAVPCCLQFKKKTSLYWPCKA
mmetsp:Transcript_123721/g.246265  ORF Transcript_123721/g.246265 Transcript_123721/m.246265 type:complete len:319 (-) Transcript_123721:487-1443(-)